MVMQGYAASYGISCDIVRLSNLYGASFGTETAIGCALRQVACGEPIALRNLTAIRDFVHADDAIEALVRLAAVGDSLAGCRIVNVSTSQGVSVREMAQTLASIAAEQGLGMPEVIQTGINQTEIVLSLVLDNSRLRELTHWTPHINLEQGLRLALQELEQNRETEH
jgi:nucleoside-diphosphate-sugar epimerase